MLTFFLFFQIVGWVGTALVLTAFLLVSLKKAEGDSIWYQGLNIVGPSFLIASFAYQGAWPGVGLNTVWIIISVFSLARRNHAVH